MPRSPLPLPIMPVQIPSPNAKRRARIEIIPLIDIIFFLLATFVMVSLSMVKSKGVPVQLPAAATGEQQNRDEFTSITVTAENAIFFNKQPIAAGELAAPQEPEGRGSCLLAGSPICFRHP